MAERRMPSVLRDRFTNSHRNSRIDIVFRRMLGGSVYKMAIELQMTQLPHPDLIVHRCRQLNGWLAPQDFIKGIPFDRSSELSVIVYYLRNMIHDGRVSHYREHSLRYTMIAAQLLWMQMPVAEVMKIKSPGYIPDLLLLRYICEQCPYTGEHLLEQDSVQQRHITHVIQNMFRYLCIQGVGDPNIGDIVEHLTCIDFTWRKSDAYYFMTASILEYILLRQPLEIADETCRTIAVQILFRYGKLRAIQRIQGYNRHTIKDVIRQGLSMDPVHSDFRETVSLFTIFGGTRNGGGDGSSGGNSNDGNINDPPYSLAAAEFLRFWSNSEDVSLSSAVFAKFIQAAGKYCSSEYMWKILRVCCPIKVISELSSHDFYVFYGHVSFTMEAYYDLHARWPVAPPVDDDDTWIEVMQFMKSSHGMRPNLALVYSKGSIKIVRWFYENFRELTCPRICVMSNIDAEVTKYTFAVAHANWRQDKSQTIVLVNGSNCTFLDGSNDRWIHKAENEPVTRMLEIWLTLIVPWFGCDFNRVVDCDYYDTRIQKAANMEAVLTTTKFILDKAEGESKKGGGGGGAESKEGKSGEEGGGEDGEQKGQEGENMSITLASMFITPVNKARLLSRYNSEFLMSEGLRYVFSGIIDESCYRDCRTMTWLKTATTARVLMRQEQIPSMKNIDMLIELRAACECGGGKGGKEGDGGGDKGGKEGEGEGSSRGRKEGEGEGDGSGGKEEGVCKYEQELRISFIVAAHMGCLDIFKRLAPYFSLHELVMKFDHASVDNYRFNIVADNIIAYALSHGLLDKECEEVKQKVMAMRKTRDERREELQKRQRRVSGGGPYFV